MRSRLTWTASFPEETFSLRQYDEPRPLHLRTLDVDSQHVAWYSLQLLRHSAERPQFRYRAFEFHRPIDMNSRWLELTKPVSLWTEYAMPEGYCHLIPCLVALPDCGCLEQGFLGAMYWDSQRMKRREFFCRRERFHSGLWISTAKPVIVVKRTSASKVWSLTCFPRAVIRIWFGISTKEFWEIHDWRCSTLHAPGQRRKALSIPTLESLIGKAEDLDGWRTRWRIWAQSSDRFQCELWICIMTSP